MPGFDPHTDTPVELLHTISLGIIKYAWHTSHTPWKSDQESMFAVRLQAANDDGLSILPIRANYIMTYANSLIGRQLKTLIQLAVFQLHDIVSSEHLNLWRAIGELSALLWYPEIDNLDIYLQDVNMCVANVLDLFAIVEPSQIVTKVKLHLLTHLCEDIRRFGPLIGESTEIFECFNAIFRTCSVYSNKLAPSRDITIQFAELEGAKQRITGGHWRDGNGKWVQASPAARLVFSTATILQAHLGWVLNPTSYPGEIKSTAKQRQAKNLLKYKSLEASKAINASSISHISDWIKVSSVTTKSGDLAKNASWVFATSPITGKTIICRILEVLQSNQSNPSYSYITVEEFQISADRHTVFGMPVLYRRLAEETILVLKSEALLFVVNVQHDCVTAGCTASGKHQVVQERHLTDILASHIEHKPLDAYIINLHALHNCHLLRRVIPRSTWAPVPYVPDSERVQRHTDLAEKLHGTQSRKRAQTKDKRNDKRNAKARDKALQQTLNDAEAESDNDDGETFDEGDQMIELDLEAIEVLPKRKKQKQAV